LPQEYETYVESDYNPYADDSASWGGGLTSIFQDIFGGGQQRQTGAVTAPPRDVSRQEKMRRRRQERLDNR